MAILDFNKFQEVSCSTRADLDIVFVHGLGGQQSRWDCVFETHWIKSHVAERFTNARILTFGYSASYTTQDAVEAISCQAQALLDDLEFAGSQGSDRDGHDDKFAGLNSLYATETCRSLLFVSHSVGGIIVKQALSIAKQRRQSSIVQRTQGILFLGSLCCSNVDREDWHQSPLCFGGFSPKCAIPENHAGAFHRIAMNYHVIRLCEDDTHCAAPYTNCDCTWQKVSQAKVAIAKDDHFRIPSSFTSPQLLSHVDHYISSLVEVAKNVTLSKVWKRQTSIQHEIKEATPPGSCDWFHASAQFLDWTHAESCELLWIKGAPGAGKTVLASFMLDHLSTNDRNVFFFFHPLHYEMEAATEIIHVLAYQIMRVSDSTLRKTSLDLLFDREQDLARPLDLEAFHSRFSRLLGMIGAQKNPVLVIDGLDRFPYRIRQIVLEEIQSCNYLRPSTAKIRYIVTSRHACSWQAASVELILESSKSHIQEVSKHTARQLERSFGNFNREEFSALVECLAARANGCFLWVNLSLQILKTIPVKDLTGAILTLPESVNEMYHRILGSVPSQHARILQTVFSWMMTSRRPLKSREISDAINIDLRSHIDEGDIFADRVATELPRVTGGLVDISKDETVRFIHSSCKDYLLSLAIGSSEEYPLTQAHQKVAQDCMILTKEFMTSPGWQSKLESDDYEVRNYAFHHWSHHFRQATPPDQPITGPLQRSLEEICDQWLREYEKTWMKHDTKALAQHLLNVGTFHGIDPLLSMSLEMGADPEGRLCPTCPSPLTLAVRAGHAAIVGKLLQKGAGAPTVVLTGPRSPLFYAVIQGRLDIVELLLNAGASVNTSLDDRGNTALHLATIASHVTMTRLLMARGADVGKTNKQYLDSALHMAAAVGSIEVFESLLDPCSSHSSSISLSKFKSSKTLQSPRSEMPHDSPHRPIRGIQTFGIRSGIGCSQQRQKCNLLNSKVVNAQNIFGQTPLHIAASNGHQTVLESLLAQGADSQLADNDHRTALHSACEQGYPDIAASLAQATLPSDGHLESLVALAEGNGHTTTVTHLSRLVLLRRKLGQSEDFSMSSEKAANIRSFKIVRNRQRMPRHAHLSFETLTG